MVGGIFNNSDILRLDFSVEYTTDRVQDNGETYLLALKARSTAVAYEQLKMTVDKKHLLPTVIECYTDSGMLIKTLRYAKIKDVSSTWMTTATP